MFRGKNESYEIEGKEDKKILLTFREKTDNNG